MKDDQVIKVLNLEELSEKFKNEVLSRFKEQGFTKFVIFIKNSGKFTTVTISIDLGNTELDCLKLLTRVPADKIVFMLSMKIPGNIDKSIIFQEFQKVKGVTIQEATDLMEMMKKKNIAKRSTQF